MKKIAIIIDGDLSNRKGQINASLNRIKHLKKIANYQIDVFAIQSYENSLVRFLRHTEKRERKSSMIVDGINISLLWNDFSLINYISVYKLNYKPIHNVEWYKKYVKLFKSYDIISAHSILCGTLAYAIHKQYKIPYFVTWHGSDIHTLPNINTYNRKNTITVLNNATNNFFVSNALLKCSDLLTIKAVKKVLYNGVSDIFINYDSDRKLLIKESLGIKHEKVVAFVGNLYPIKNVLLLPDIFEKISSKYGGELVFWIIGDGNLYSSLLNILQTKNITFKLWGNQPVEKMPDFMNCIDVLVLPSKNEGLPLVTVEALACGTNVVGTDVGGISEVIGENNVFVIDEKLSDNIANRVVKMLKNNIYQPLNEIFDWKKTALLENEQYINCLIKRP